MNTTFGPFCWPDDCYIINQYDAFGDGWFAGIAGDIRIVNAVDGSTITLTPAFSQEHNKLLFQVVWDVLQVVQIQLRLTMTHQLTMMMVLVRIPCQTTYLL